MGSIGPIQILAVILLILVLFGRGKISEMMGDVGKGIRSFKKGISESDEPEKPAPRIESDKIVNNETKAAKEAETK